MKEGCLRQRVPEEQCFKQSQPLQAKNILYEPVRLLPYLYVAPSGAKAHKLKKKKKSDDFIKC